MNLTAADIDRIVAEVVRRLRTMMASSSVAQVRTAPATATFNELQLDDKVVTLRTLSGRLDGVNKIVVNQRAVVTPAVKDELKQRGIAWERATATAKARS